MLKNARYCSLKRACNLTIRESTKLRELLKYDLKSLRALALKESFDDFWQYESSHWAKWYLKKWCARAMRSKLDPMKKFVGTLRAHEDLLMNYFTRHVVLERLGTTFPRQESGLVFRH